MRPVLVFGGRLTRPALAGLMVALTLPGLGCGTPDDGPEGTVQASESGSEAGFGFKVTGSIEAEIEGRGRLRCIDMGDSGPGYFQLDNGERTGTIKFQFPLDAAEGNHSVTAWTEVAAARQVGEAYSMDVSLPLQGFHKSTAAEGSLTFEEVGTRPGERIRGYFDVKTESLNVTIEVEGSFDFSVPDGARDRC